MRLLALALLFGFISTVSVAQQRTLAKFVITDASINDQDATETYLQSGGYIAFYTIGDGNLYMTNFMSKLYNSQSFGRLYSTEHKKIRETYETYEADVFYFRWRYINSYNSAKGTATVELIKIYKPQGITFSCTIIPENLDVLVYKGYMDGSLDFSNYSN
jgi:hypothetical protein